VHITWQPGPARYAGLVSTCTDSPACTQYGAPVPADAPTDVDIDVALRTTVVALLEAARGAIADADHAAIVTYVGAATDLLGALAVRS
jgi:hypothetical protein